MDMTVELLKLFQKDIYLCHASGFYFWQGQQILSFLQHPDQLWRHTQSPTQWVAGALPLEVKWLGPEADHSPPSSARLRICGAITPLPHTSS
jgi:hypothetical protein